MQALTPNVRWNVCSEIHVDRIQNTWRLAEAEFIISNRNNSKHFKMSGDRKIVFVVLISHAFAWNPPQFGQMNTVTLPFPRFNSLSRW